ncbi:tubulin delta chain [Hyla sarda]|uniref:tubulin delta chain n=1 Tax=Hyla sarda TaxID=327740 RepID=UPI0024C3FEE9|nr:tubulin delta chain [Hyla sarda]XP_056412653.1 tubulin delta chain [Hyla sarda]XP_056412655.1 tubulin delta chain [Hyla sarda]XP_056412656.1 tubulin delta chain [Hyla sarda]XP_056412657.1 tubulin delta chain [Hyla sarda]
MSFITVQLGQCGNQIGYELFDVISNDIHSNGLCTRKENELYQAASKERFFDETESGDFVSRAVLLDMEPKVISQTLSRATHSGKWRYSEKSQFSQKQGSGNNWANGYYVHGPKHKDFIMNLVRKEAEKCDRLSGFITIMSMAGGTGSGMGTFVTRCLRDFYPNSLLLNEVIWPYGTGEVIVQNYNSILTLSHLYESSDALLVHENDIIHKVCSQRMNIKQISFQDVNKVIAHQLGSVFQPAYTADGALHYSRNPLGELMESLVPHPEFKLLGLGNIPQMSEHSLAYSTFTWHGLIKHLRQMLIANAKMEEGINWQVQLPSKLASGRNSLAAELQFNKSVANLAMFRGKDIEEASPEGFREPALYTSWLPPDNSFSIWKTPRAFNKYEKSATLMSNSQGLLKPLDTIVGKAWTMFASKAYVHQYTKYGIEEEDFLQSFTTLEQIISSYSTL